MIVLFSLLMLSGCRNNAASADAQAASAPVMRTVAVEATTWRPTAEITGTLDPAAVVQLGFAVPGRIKDLYVTRGTFVKKGDRLAHLDSAIAEAQLAQARAGVSAAQAQATDADATIARLRKMTDAGGISEQQLGDAEAKVTAAKAQLEQAHALAQMAETQLVYNTLAAPIDGVISNGPDNTGQLVAAGTPLFLIEDISTLRLRGTAPEEDTWLQAGLDATVRGGDPNEAAGIAAKVDRVIPSLDPVTRRIPVEIVVSSPPDALRAHEFGRATVTSGTDQPAFLVDKAAVVARPDFSVFVQPQPGAAPTRVPVTVLGDKDGKDVVSGALKAGDLVVLDPPHGYGD